MNKNNKGSWRPDIFTYIVIIASVLIIGFIIYTSPKQQAATTASLNPNDSMSAMHGGSPGAANTEQLNALLNKPLPDIQLADKDGKTYTTADFKGKYTVLFFNEGLMCYPACWNQIASFGSDSRFNSRDIQAISVVVDPVKDWQKATKQMPQLASANTMFDNGANVSRQLGMLTTNSSMHRGSLPGHTYVLVDKDGIVRYVFDDPNMANANDSLFNKIQELSKI